MPITVQCGGCGASYTVADAHAGGAVTCPKCKISITLPSTAPPPASHVQQPKTIRVSTACLVSTGLCAFCALSGFAVSVLARPSSAQYQEAVSRAELAESNAAIVRKTAADEAAARIEPIKKELDTLIKQNKELSRKLATQESKAKFVAEQRDRLMREKGKRMWEAMTSSPQQSPPLPTTADSAELSDEQKFQIFSEMGAAIKKVKEVADAKYAPGTPDHNAYLTEYATESAKDVLKRHGLAAETFDLEKFGKEAIDKGWNKRLKSDQEEKHVAFAGSGSKSTETFETQSRSWKLAWTCDQFISIQVFSEGKDVPVEIVGSETKNGHSIVRCPPGRYYLKIIGLGEWSVKVHP